MTEEHAEYTPLPPKSDLEVILTLQARVRQLEAALKSVGERLTVVLARLDELGIK